MENKQKIKNFIKYLKKDSSFSILKIIITVLTAVSMAMLATKITSSVTSSLVITAIVSISTALVSEFYRIIVTASAYGAKKVIEIIPVDPVRSVIHSETAETNGASSDNGESEHILDVEITTLKPQSKLSNFWAKRYYLIFIILFAGISAITIFASYSVANNIEKNEIHNSYTTVQETKKETIPEETKKEIIDTATTEAKEQATYLAEQKAKEQALIIAEEKANEKVQEQKLTTDEQIKELKENNSTLTQEIAKLQKELEESKAQNSLNETKLGQLEEQIKELIKLIEIDTQSQTRNDSLDQNNEPSTEE